MSTRIRFRRSTAATWISANPTLTLGELGYETNTGKFKIGDNATSWTSLPYSITAELSEGNLNDLKDVIISSPTSGQVLKWNGTAWINDTDSSGSAINALDDVTDVTITSATSGQFLKWNGTAWVNDAIDLGTDTTGSYITSLVAGTGVTLANNSGEGATPTVTVDTTVIQARVANVTDTEIGYLDGVSSAIQTQINTKANIASPTFTGTVTVPTPSGNTDAATKAYVDSAQSAAQVYADTLTVSISSLTDGVTATAAELNILDGATLSTTELNYVDGVTSAIQTQINTKAPIASPTFTGTVTVPDNSFVLGTKTTGDYVQSLVAGTGVTLTNNSGETATPTIAIGQAVGTGSNVTFNDLTVTGNLTVSGTTTSINTETLTVDDNIVVLNNNATGAPTQNAGLEIERGSSTNVALRWNETDDKWQFTNDGSVYTDLGSSGAVISASAPNSPTAGQLWFDEDTAQTFVYYDSSWIEVGASGMAATISDTAPSSPIAGQVWFNSSSGATFIYYGGVWVEVGVAPFDQLLSTLDAKGDLLVGTADNTVTKLAVGSASQVLTVDSTTATGLKWSTPTVYQAVVTNVSDTEIGYLDGVTSAIQTQLGTKASTGKAIAMSIVFSG